MSNAYENFDTTSWPNVGPIKNAFVGSAARFDVAAELYEDFEEGWVPWALFTEPEGQDDTVEKFLGDPDNGFNEFEFWEDEWVLKKPHPDDAGITWSLVGAESFNDWIDL